MGYTISNAQIAALLVELTATVAVPIVLLVWWQKRTHSNALPVVVGMLGFVVFAQILELILHQAFLLSNNVISRTINSSPLLYALYGGIAAGLFEETARYMAFKYVLRRHPERNTAISYGIGHGGYECVAVVGMTVLSYLLMALMLRAGLVDMVMDSFAPEEQELVKLVLEQVAETTPRLCLIGILERLIALGLQLALSVLVFAAVRQPERAGLYPLALALHALADFGAGYYQAGGLTGTVGILVAELTAAVVAAAAIRIALRVWRSLPEKSGPENFPKE